MNGSPDKKLIEAVALEMGIAPSFVEKDWYVTQAIKTVSSVQIPKFSFVFTGGTALSKAHKLIQRFSEDTDFRVLAPSLSEESGSQQRKILSGFKSQLIEEVKKVFPLDKEHVLARNGNQFIRLELTYPTFFERQRTAFLKSNIRIIP